ASARVEPAPAPAPSAREQSTASPPPPAEVKPTQSAGQTTASNKDVNQKRKTARKEPRAGQHEVAPDDAADTQTIVVRDSSGKRRTIVIRLQQDWDGRRVNVFENGRERTVETTGRSDRGVQERRGGVSFADEPPGSVQRRERPGGFLSDLFSFGRGWNN